MDAALKLLADASLHASQAEEAVGEGAWTAATERLDAGRAALQSVRDAWSDMAPGHRAVVGPAARQVRERLDAAERRVPRRRTLVEVPAEPDDDEAEPPA